MSRFASYSRVPSSANAILYVLVLLLLLLECVPNVYFFQFDAAPCLFLVPIFYLAVFSETEASPLVILLFGFLKDVLSGMPFGFWGVLLCGFYLFAYTQRQLMRNEGDFRRWFMFTIMCFVMYFVANFMAAVMRDLPAAFLTIMGSALLTSLAYPFMAILLKLILYFVQPPEEV